MTIGFKASPTRVYRSMLEKLSRQAIVSFIALCASILLCVGSRAEAGQGCDPTQPWQRDLVLTGHDTEVQAVAWSPDGSKIASGAEGPALNVWATDTGELLTTISTQARVIASLAWSPDSAQLANGGGGGAMDTIEIWSAQTWERMRVLTELQGWAFSTAWSPDGSLIMGSDGGGHINFWDNDTGALLSTLTGTPYTDYVWSLAWSPDGSRFISGTGPFDDTVKIWDSASGSIDYTLRGHAAIIYSVSWSSNDRQVASSSGDGTIKIWDPDTGALIQTLSDRGSPVLSVAFSPDGTQLATGSLDAMVRIWDAATGSLQAALRGQGDATYSVSWSPDGTRLAFASGNMLEIWSQCF
jgi:WD40 repeat protein